MSAPDTNRPDARCRCGATLDGEQCLDCGRPRRCKYPDCFCQPDIGCRAEQPAPRSGAPALSQTGDEQPGRVEETT